MLNLTRQIHTVRFQVFVKLFGHYQLYESYANYAISPGTYKYVSVLKSPNDAIIFLGIVKGSALSNGEN